MDRRERDALAGSGLESESGNVRADGFFSVQVRELYDCKGPSHSRLLPPPLPSTDTSEFTRPAGRN